MNAVRLLALVAALTLTGCQANQPAAADPIEHGLNETFTLDGGHEAMIRGEDLRLRFTDVLEDSRCPKRVECFWTGEARIVVVIEQLGQTPTPTEFNTNPAPDQNTQTARVGPYTVDLQALDPYPQTPEESTALADYRATFTVRKTD